MQNSYEKVIEEVRNNREIRAVILTGEAEKLGIVNKVVTHEELVKEGKLIDYNPIQ